MHELIERAGFALSLHNHWLFRKIVRPELYRRAGSDPEDVHRLALEMANRYGEVAAAHQDCFDFPELTVDYAARWVQDA